VSTLRPYLATWLPRLALVAASLLFAEGALQAVSLVSPAAAEKLSGLKPRYIADPVLDVRGDPSSPEYDEAGFRNCRRAKRASVVVIGDSQTEGSGVARENAWPQRLAHLREIDVYQMAFGSYGPGHYLSLVDEALALEPETLIVALYTGNDLAGVYEWVYDKGRDNDLRSSDRRVLEALAAAEREHGPIDAAWRRTRDAEKGLTGRPVLRWVRTHIEQRSKLVALYDQLSWRLSGRNASLEKDAATSDWSELESVTAGVPPDLLYLYADSGVRTVFTPEARFAALDLNDPRIAEALRITLIMLDRIASLAASRVDLAVTLVPTKELVFKERVEAHASSVPRAFSDLVRVEEQIRDGIKAFLDQRGVRWIDPLPEMRRYLDTLNESSAGDSPYPDSWDGHPAAPGHESIARAVMSSGIRGESHVAATSADAGCP
jgi:hypothetical protein